MSNIIALLTDFGTASHYVAMVKAVIVGINRRVRLIDISHDVPAHNIREASFVLASSFRYFPEGTVFLVVVDPGVGSKRAAIAIKTKHFYFVGPDNGALYEAARRDGIQQIRCLDNKKYCLPEISSTFQGRDVFAPFAAHLSCGLVFSRLGRTKETITKVIIPKPVRQGSFIEAEIIYVDRFGNLITSADSSTAALLRKAKAVGLLNKKRIFRYLSCYADANAGEPFFIEGSSGYLEISLKQGAASRFFRAEAGDTIRWTFEK